MVKDCRDINELHPYVKHLAEKLLAECKKQGLNIIITETYRTKERQDYLYAQGRTRPGSIVTNAKGSDMQSMHQWRLAFDICHNKRGDEYNNTILNKVGKIGRNLGLSWGGDWTSFVDKPHFEYTEGLTIKDLKAGKTIKAKVKPENIIEVKKSIEKFNLDGKMIDIEVLDKDDTGYVKLRDLECSKIEVTWDPVKKVRGIRIRED